jgi:hypothetical protein
MSMMFRYCGAEYYNVFKVEEGLLPLDRDEDEVDSSLEGSRSIH